jgi:hypothetical protein
MNIIYTDNTLDLTNLKRKPEVEKEYQSLLKVIKNAGSTPEQAVLESLNGESLVKVINPFRYELDDTMEHYLVWTTEPDNTYTFDTFELFRFQLGDKKIFFSKHSLVAIFDNSDSKKSVSLKHWHVIVRK